VQNKINDGKTIVYTAPAGQPVKGGDLVVVGTVAGVAVADIAENATGVLEAEGVFELDKLAAALAPGVLAYPDAATGKITGEASSESGEDTQVHPAVGRVWAAAVAGEPTVRVKLNV
jgi:predicted RecA/RadA family phage recombinase